MVIESLNRYFIIIGDGLVDIFYRQLAQENWILSGGSLQASQLQTSDASTNVYCFLNPVTLTSLGGTPTNTISPSTIAASTLMKNSLHAAVTAADYTFASWSAAGWEPESIEIFRSQLKLWVENNFASGTVLNTGSETVNVYILRKVEAGVYYTLPIIYVGNTGTAVSTITANISLSHLTPVFSQSLPAMSGVVTDNGVAVNGVNVTVQIITLLGKVLQTQTAQTSGSGNYSVTFTGSWVPNVYYLSFSANVNGQEITKTRLLNILADAVPTSAIVTTSTPIVDGTSFTATITVTDQYSVASASKAVSLTYNGTTQSGSTNNLGQFQTTFTASTSATSITYDVDSGTLTGSHSITVQSGVASTVSITQSPNPAIDTESVTITATVSNSNSTPLSGKSVSLTYNGTTLTGTTDGSGQVSKTFTTAYGVDTVSYDVNSGELSSSASITTAMDAQIITTVNIGVPVPATVDIDQSFTVDVTVLDQYSLGIDNEAVTLYEGANIIGTGTTNNLGVSSITSSFAASGSYSIFAEAGAVQSGTESVTVVPPVPAAAIVTLDAPTMNPIDTTQSAGFTARVYDQFNNLMSGQTVTFYNGVTPITSQVTNLSGETTLTFSSASTGTFSITAESGSAVSSPQSIVVQSIPELFSITLGSPSPSSVSENATFTVNVNTYDQYSNPYPNVTVDVYETGTVTLLGSDTTDLSGFANIICTALVAGNITIEARSGAIASGTEELTVTAAPVPTTLTVSAPGSASVFSNISISGTVLDQFGNPISGLYVFFAHAFGVGNATTDGSGVAATTIQAYQNGQLEVTVGVSDGTQTVLQQTIYITIF